ncbi:hypothetical protein SPHV1_1730003 [Novosphingobium sp. KN65.2]|nr:hypothetical protein SPHV1_1730003 [Novosphingobium sp. KN65.2]
MLADKDERARRLRSVIAKTGMSITDVAKRHNFKVPTLTSHANGTRVFDIETGYAYAKAFKVDPVWLMGLRGDEPEALTLPAEDLREMIGAAMRELPIGATIEDYLRIVPEALRERLEQYLAVGGFRGSEPSSISPGTSAQSHAPTKPGAGA